MVFFRRLFSRSKEPIELPIQVFVRHCHFSAASSQKRRPPSFSRKACHENLLAYSDARVCFTFLLDGSTRDDHFIGEKAELIQGGTESLSFLALLDHVMAQSFSPRTLIYFLEDDYLHRPGWIDILLEGFTTNADYVTLYDHKDKYLHYPKLSSQIFATQSCHWRTTPSTTNTYAMRFSTLQKDFSIHRRFSLGRKITRDHDKFCFLAKKGAMLISSIPGWATHADVEFASPCFEWEPLYKETLCKS